VARVLIRGFWSFCLAAFEWQDILMFMYQAWFQGIASMMTGMFRESGSAKVRLCFANGPVQCFCNPRSISLSLASCRHQGVKSV
jgi:hypothetical protein